MSKLPEQHSRPDLDFVGEAPVNNDASYSERAKRNFKSISERVAELKAQSQGEK